MLLEIIKVTKNKDDFLEEKEYGQLELIENCLPVCNPKICNPDTGECQPTFKP